MIFYYILSIEKPTQSHVGGTDGHTSGAVLGSMVNRAGALFSNIKDVSSKVMQSVAG